MAYRLKRDTPLTLWGADVVVPQGAAVILVKNASGTKGDLFAIASGKLVADLTGNTHDPKYRYAFVSPADVEEC